MLGLAVVGWAAWGVLAKVALRTGASWAAMQCLLAFGFVVAAWIGALPKTSPRELLNVSWGTLAALLAGLAAGGASLAFGRALESIDVSVAAPVGGSYVVLVALVSFALLDEPLPANRVLGIAFAMIGTALLARS